MLADNPLARRIALAAFVIVFLLTLAGVIPPHDSGTTWELR